MSRPHEERKERVIHSRVPEALDDEIKRKARRLGVSVSNLVRNVLEHTVELVEDILTDGAEIARSTASERKSEPEPDAVLGWQHAVLDLNAVCEACNALLPRGQEAAIGITREGGPHFRCRPCADAVPQAANAETRHAE